MRKPTKLLKDVIAHLEWRHRGCECDDWKGPVSLCSECEDGQKLITKITEVLKR